MVLHRMSCGERGSMIQQSRELIGGRNVCGDILQFAQFAYDDGLLLVLLLDLVDLPHFSRIDANPSPRCVHVDVV